MSPLRKLYSQVLIGIAAGILLGVASPAWGLAVKPLGDAFVASMRMLLAPIISAPSCTASPVCGT